MNGFSWGPRLSGPQFYIASVPFLFFFTSDGAGVKNQGHPGVHCLPKDTKT